jgi:hypothetical protein
LPAISGFAKELQPNLFSEYMAGIWSNDLHGLLWAVDTNVPFVFQTLDEWPTWSWASIPGPISYRWLHEQLDWAGEDVSFPMSHVVQNNVMPLGSDPKGRCASGMIEVIGRGRLITSKQEFMETRHTFFREDRFGSFNQEYSESNPILLLRILGSRGRGAFGLVLKASKQGWEGEFRRTGVMGGIDETWFDAGFDLRIKIV